MLVHKKNGQKQPLTVVTDSKSQASSEGKGLSVVDMVSKSKLPPELDSKCKEFLNALIEGHQRVLKTGSGIKRF